MAMHLHEEHVPDKLLVTATILICRPLLETHAGEQKKLLEQRKMFFGRWQEHEDVETHFNYQDMSKFMQPWLSGFE